MSDARSVGAGVAPPDASPRPWGPPPLEITPGVAPDCAVDTPVQTWPDLGGVVRAAAYRSNPGYVLDWFGIAVFSLRGKALPVRAIPYPGVRAGNVEETYARSVAPLAWQAFCGEALHASAVVIDGAAVVCCAASGTGKTTLAWGLRQRGHPFLADDSVLLSAGGTAVMAFAPPHAARLRSPSAVFFGLADPGRAGRAETQIDFREPRPIGAFFVLERSGTRRDASAQRLEGTIALSALLEHAHCVDPTHAAARRRAVACYLACVSGAPVWRLQLPSTLDGLPSCLDLVERSFRGTRP